MSNGLKAIHRKSRKADKKNEPKAKMCVKCKSSLHLSKFYMNREWTEQHGRDAWCKSCVQDFCVSKATLQEYCYYNNKEFSEDAYQKARDRAPYEVSSDPVFNRAGTTQRERDEAMNKAISRQYFRLMSMAAYYKYTPNIGTRGMNPVPDFIANPPPPAPVLSGMNHEDTVHGEERTYSEKWWGHYTQREIQFLEDYYNQLMSDFPMDTGTVRDYAVKAARQSLIVNDLQEKFKRGDAKIGELQDAIRTFDMLNQSSNFAESRRKPGDSAGLGSFGELILKIEQTGILDTRKVEFEPDDVDMLRNDLRHTSVAIGDVD